VVGGVAARRRNVPIYPLVGLVVIVVLAIAPTIGAVRYRAPAEIALVILAAVGIDAVVRWVAARRTPAPDEMIVDLRTSPAEQRAIVTT
jgi:hypothetical protein